MKKQVVAALLALTLAVSMTACSGKGSKSSKTSSNGAATGSTAAAEWATDDDAYASGIKASDYVTLPKDYDNLKVTVEKEAEVTDEQVQAQIDSNLSNAQTLVEVTDRDTVQDGDVVNIDYVGKIDGKKFSGGSAEGYDLTIGSGSFIDGFESGLVGHKKGESVTLNLTFPKDYSTKKYAGKAVVFEVKINKIEKYQTPELTDDWVKSQNITTTTGTAVRTVKEYKTYIRSQLEEQSTQNYQSTLQNAVLEQLSKEAKFKKNPPKNMIQRYNDYLISQFTYYAQSYGVDLATYMNSVYGFEKDEYEDQIWKAAKSYAKDLVLLQAVAEKENLNPTDKEMESELQQYAASNGYTSVEDISRENQESYRENIMRTSAMDFLLKHATIKQVDSTAADTSAAASTEAAAQESTTEAVKEAATSAAAATEAAAAATTK